MTVNHIRMPSQPNIQETQRKEQCRHPFEQKMKTDVGHPCPMALDTRIRQFFYKIISEMRFTSHQLHYMIFHICIIRLGNTGCNALSTAKVEMCYDVEYSHITLLLRQHENLSSVACLKNLAHGSGNSLGSLCIHYSIVVGVHVNTVVDKGVKYLHPIVVGLSLV